MQTAPTTTPAPVQAQSTFDFIASIGVDTHLNDANDAYATLSGSFVSEFEYLGLSLAGASLDGLSFTGGGGLHYLGLVEAAMAAGIRFNLVVSPATSVATAISDLNQLETLYPGMVAFVTGQNEVPPSGLAAAQAYQDQLYAAIKADPLLSSIGDITYSIGSMNPAVYTSLGNQSANTGYGAVHTYAGPYPPQIYDSYYVLVNNSGTPNDPFVVTETGNPSVAPGISITGSLPDYVAERYELDLIFDLLLDGATAVGLYELLDQISDPTSTQGSEEHFGLFTVTGAPKPDGTAIHNLTTILADPGSNAANFTPGTLSYSISGVDSTLNPSAAETAFDDGIFTLYVNSQPIYGASYLLEKSNGTFDIAVWQEPELWDNTTETILPDSATPVTVTLGQTAQSIEVYDPLIGTAPIATYSDVSAVTIEVSDHPIIIEVDPFAAGTAPAASTSPAVVTVGSGIDTLTLYVADSGQAGGAQFTVTINGLQIGGVQTTTAASANGQSQQFNFLGNFAAGANSIVVTYLNASNSTLSIDSVDINGTYVPGSFQTLSNNGSVTSSFTQTTGPAAVSLGSGPNVLDLFISEIGANSGAQFTISVDGQQIGGVQTTTANGAQGQVQQFDVAGTFATGLNTVTIDYLNASNSTLSLDSATINGAGIAAGTLTLSNNGAGDLSFNQGGSGLAPVTLGSGADTLAIFVSDRGQPGAANFTITVDGQQYGGVQTTTANSVLGQTQQFDILGNFGVGNHTVAISYLNASNSLFFVDGATIDETAVANSGLGFNNNGTATFAFTKPGTAIPLAVAAPVPVTTPVAAPVTTPVTTPVVAPVTTPSSGGGSSGSSSSPSSTGTVVIGSGVDTLALSISERAAVSGAQFTVSVDGTQIGGVQTTTASSVAGQSQTFDVEGNFATGSNTVSIDYLNAANSLLLVNSATINSAAVPSSSLVLANVGSAGFGFTVPAASTGTGTQVIGSGSDTLALSMSQRSEPTGAEFTVSVDGTQIGGVQTTTANSVTGQSQLFDVEGNFGSGNHVVTVDYLNAANSLLDVSSATIDGNAIAGGNLVVANSGSEFFGFSEGAGGTPEVVGSGSDTLTLLMSERAALGGAQFTISVDGIQVGGVQTVSASSTAGQAELFDVLGNFGAGTHNVSIDYLNASNSLLNVAGVTIDGANVPGSGITLANTGSAGFNFTEPTIAASATGNGSGPDKLDMFVSERGEPGGAQFTVDVNGQQIGGVQTTAANAVSGQEQEFDFLGSFSQSNNTVSINYLNASNSLFLVDAATINGTTIGGSNLVESNSGSSGFNFEVLPAPPLPSIGSGPDVLALNLSEDYYRGNAQFTVSVDGQQIGGVQTAQAIAGNGQSQVLDVYGSFGGTHTVAVDFLNDASGPPQPSLGYDRNLYINGATIDGTSVAKSALSLYNTGTQSFTFTH